jgi:hypothetical protein
MSAYLANDRIVDRRPVARPDNRGLALIAMPIAAVARCCLRPPCARTVARVLPRFLPVVPTQPAPDKR